MRGVPDASKIKCASRGNKNSDWTYILAVVYSPWYVKAVIWKGAYNYTRSGRKDKMLRENSKTKSKGSKIKRQSGIFMLKTDTASMTYHNLSSLKEDDGYVSQTKIATLSPVIRSNNRGDDSAPGHYCYSTVRSTSNQSISSNLSFLSTNSSVLDLIYQDLEQSSSKDQKICDVPRNNKATSSSYTKAMFVIQNDTNKMGEWKFLNDTMIDDTYPDFLPDNSQKKISRTVLDFS